MLSNYSPDLGRTDIEMETDFKVIKELYNSGRRAANTSLDRGRDFLLNEFILHPHFSANELRIKNILENKVVLKNIFIKDLANGKIIYYGRLKTETEKFSEAVEGLF